MTAMGLPLEKTPVDRPSQQPTIDTARFTYDIDVYSDTICPWCYIGKKTLDIAIATYAARHPDVDFRLTWKPYMLWPNAAVSAYHKGNALRAIYGDRAPALFERLGWLGIQYEIDFRWDGMTGNSRDSHKLILLAMEQDEASSPEGSATASSPSLAAAERVTVTTAHDPTLGSPPTTTDNNNNNNNNNTTPRSALPIHPHPQARGTQPEPSPPTARPLSYKLTAQERAISYLFHASFGRGKDLSSRAFLVRAAVDLGLCPTEAAAHAYLDGPQEGSTTNDEDGAAGGDDSNNNNNGDDDRDPRASNSENDSNLDPGQRVDASSAFAREQLGVTAVPSYIVQGRFQVGGMQGEDVWMGLFDRVRAAAAESTAAAAGPGAVDAGQEAC